MNSAACFKTIKVKKNPNVIGYTEAEHQDIPQMKQEAYEEY